MMEISTSHAVLEAADRGDVGAVVRLSRRARGETQVQTAVACGFTQSDISRLEQGMRHTHDIRFLQKVATHLDIPPNLLGLAHDTADAMEPPVNRREFVAGAAAALAAAALPKFDIDPVELTDVRAVTATFRRMDSILPSHDLTRPVAAHVQMVSDLLERASAAKSKTWLAESASEGASLAAWLAWDRADYAAADRYYRRAVKLADTAGHPLLTAYQLGSLASLMIDRRDRKALDVLALARHKLGSRPTSIADSWTSALEALANATMGYTEATWSALDRAELACARTDDEQPPWPWVFSFGTDKVAAQRVTCAARLGQPQRVLSSLPEFAVSQGTHRRQRALLSLDLAEVYIQAGDTERGCELAAESLQLVHGDRSGRVMQRAKRMRDRNAGHLAQPDLQALEHCLRCAS